MPQLHLFLADVILVTHALIVLFNLVSLPLIWLGYFCRWRFVRNFYFRAVHVAMLAYISLQACGGKLCPLTIWENTLRREAGAEGHYAGSFITHWVQRLIFIEADERTFVVAYALFFLLVLLTWFLVKPEHPRWWQKTRQSP